MKRISLTLTLLIWIATPSIGWAQPAPTTGPVIPKIAPLKNSKRIKPVLSERAKKRYQDWVKRKRKRLKRCRSRQVRRKRPKTRKAKKEVVGRIKTRNQVKKISPSASKSQDDDKKGWQNVDGKGNENQEISSDFIKKCRPLKPGVKVTLNIYDEELSNITKIIACMTGKNIIVPKSLKGKKITIYSPSVVSAQEAYRAFLTALEANGFTISRQGRFLRIVDIKDFVRKSDPLKGE